MSPLHRDLLRLTKSATASPDGYGEIKAYKPNAFQSARDWWKTNTQDTPRLDGSMGANPSTFNTLKNTFTSPPATAVASGGLRTAGTLASAVRPWAGKALGAASSAVNPAWTAGADLVEKAIPAAPTPAPAPSPAPAAESDGHGFNFSSLAPFLPFLMQMLGGGGQGPQQPMAPPSALDQLAARSPYA
jgi:hypothetical protein